MNLVEVYVVRAQPLEAGLAALDDVLAREPAVVGAGVAGGADFGRL